MYQERDAKWLVDRRIKKKSKPFRKEIKEYVDEGVDRPNRM